MRLAESVKPISYFKAHAAEIIKKISEDQNTIIITQNGEAKVVIQDIHTFEQTKESLAMLKLLAVSRKNFEHGKFRPAGEVLKDLKEKVEKDFAE